jgi:KDO2-lipid IV(A) lauroyltransferase
MMLLLRWVAHWPLGLVQFCGAVLGWIVWAASPSYRRRLAANARQAGLTPAQARAAVAQAGRMSAEVPWLWFRTADRPLGALIQWDGEALVEQAIQAGKGLLLLTPHLGAFEFAARGYAERFGQRQPITVLYRPARQAMLAEWQTYSRTAGHAGRRPASPACGRCCGPCARAKRWACCPTRCRRTGRASGCRTSAARPTP